MKKIFGILFVFFAVSILAGCSKEEKYDDPPSGGWLNKTEYNFPAKGGELEIFTVYPHKYSYIYFPNSDRGWISKEESNNPYVQKYEEEYFSIIGKKSSKGIVYIVRVAPNKTGKERKIGFLALNPDNNNNYIFQPLYCYVNYTQSAN